jgi:hypothetical protein
MHHISPHSLILRPCSLRDPSCSKPDHNRAIILGIIACDVTKPIEGDQTSLISLHKVVQTLCAISTQSGISNSILLRHFPLCTLLTFVNPSSAVLDPHWFGKMILTFWFWMHLHTQGHCYEQYSEGRLCNHRSLGRFPRKRESRGERKFWGKEKFCGEKVFWGKKGFQGDWEFRGAKELH